MPKRFKEKKESKEMDMNLYYFKNEIPEETNKRGTNIKNDRKKDNIEDMMRKKAQKEREQRIKQNKIKSQEDDFDLDTETVIQMTNKNKLKKEEERRKAISKQERKRQRRNKRIKLALKIILLVGIIAGGIAFALTSPIFNIKDIKVSNNNLVNSETVVSLSEIKTEQNIFKFTKIQAINKIKENPYIEAVEIHRKLPSTIQIDIEERIPTYSIDYMGKYAIINNQGYVLEISEDNKGYPVILGSKTAEQEMTPNQRLNDEDLEKMEDVLKIMSSAKENNLDTKVTNIDITTKNEYSIYLAEEKKKVYLGDSSNITNKMLYIVAILEQEKDKEGEIYINGDLNNKFQPYFREKV